jgi:hypothetical protein
MVASDLCLTGGGVLLISLQPLGLVLLSRSITCTTESMLYDIWISKVITLNLMNHVRKLLQELYQHAQNSESIKLSPTVLE